MIYSPVSSQCDNFAFYKGCTYHFAQHMSCTHSNEPNKTFPVTTSKETNSLFQCLSAAGFNGKPYNQNALQPFPVILRSTERVLNHLASIVGLIHNKPWTWTIPCGSRHCCGASHRLVADRSKLKCCGARWTSPLTGCPVLTSTTCTTEKPSRNYVNYYKGQVSSF